MARGQITIEFVLILIVVLVIITSVSLPLINYASDTLMDTGSAVILAQTIQRIKGSADAVSTAGCGSYQIIPIDKQQLDSVVGVYYITISGDGGAPVKVNASYYLQNGTLVSLKPVFLPEYVNVICNGNSLKIVKTCDSTYPNTKCYIQSGG